ncbi:tautomerase family protein [Listeria costaricensis]|uniref:tautomerase family protein n=1 Tax=Listeria costaricensis TaxID=2026604 RepID=UPI000C07A23A|nr:tautomerase family protein [Listeria costaricensis]
MPLLNIDVLEGRSDAELRLLLDTIHTVVVAAFGVPERDRYQILHQHKKNEMIIEDTGLGLDRTDKVVIIRMTSKKRTPAQKQTFYRLLAEQLEEKLAIQSSDIMVSIVENSDADWSFGFGRAQFLTGEL